MKAAGCFFNHSNSLTIKICKPVNILIDISSFTLLSGKIFRSIASLWMTGNYGVLGKEGLVGGFAANQPLLKDKILTVISNVVRNLIYIKNLDFYRTIVIFYWFSLFF